MPRRWPRARPRMRPQSPSAWTTPTSTGRNGSPTPVRSNPLSRLLPSSACVSGWQTHGRCADGNWVEYDELKAYEDGQSESGPRSRKHKKGRKGRGQAKPPKKYLIPPMQ